MGVVGPPAGAQPDRVPMPRTDPRPDGAPSASGASETDADRTLVAGALAGERDAGVALVRRLTPALSRRVLRTLLRHRPSGSRPVRQEVEDQVQQVWCDLLAHGGKKLRAWDPDKGLALESFASLVAEHTVISSLRSKQRLWRDDPTAPEALTPRVVDARSPEGVAASRQMLTKLEERLDETLSERGRLLFKLLLIEGLSSREAGAITGLSANAVDQWRSRLKRTVRQLRSELDSEGTP